MANEKTKQNKPALPETPLTPEMQYIQQAIQQGASVETLERLVDLRNKMFAEHAREEFVRAMAGFQAECPTIHKNKTVLNKDGKSVRYKYATLDSIVEQVKESLKRHGLSYTVDAKVEEEMVTATCKVTHELGHSETSSFAVPIDKESYMNQQQRFAAALTFAKRYAFCNALGILTGDEDTDSTTAGKENGNPLSQKSKIIFNLKQLDSPTDTKEAIEKAVKEKTDLELKEENFGDIVERLEILVQEKNEDSSSINIE